jgi:hypothetical protein
MGRTLAIAAAAAGLVGLGAVAAVAGTGAAEGRPSPASFRLEDGSAGCTLRSSGDLACRAAGSAEAVVLEPGGGSRADAAETVEWDEATPVLLAAESWWVGEFSCRAPGSRIVCAAGDGTIGVGGGR